jgi:hypothetical protein
MLSVGHGQHITSTHPHVTLPRDHEKSKRRDFFSLTTEFLAGHDTVVAYLRRWLKTPVFGVHLYTWTLAQE